MKRTVNERTGERTVIKARSEATPRCLDDRKCLCAYSDPILINCPQCCAPGILKLSAETFAERGWQGRRFFGCTICGHTFNWKPRLIIHSGRNWNEVLPLALQTPCCGQTLWAFNDKHLDAIERYTAALIRERVGCSNASLASRLPQWIKSAKNRETVLKAIRKLRRSKGAT